MKLGCALVRLSYVCFESRMHSAEARTRSSQHQGRPPHHPPRLRFRLQRRRGRRDSEQACRPSSALCVRTQSHTALPPTPPFPTESRSLFTTAYSPANSAPLALDFKNTKTTCTCDPVLAGRFRPQELTNESCSVLCLGRLGVIDCRLANCLRSRTALREAKLLPRLAGRCLLITTRILVSTPPCCIFFQPIVTKTHPRTLPLRRPFPTHVF